ncbi:MAG: hypothetical protein EOO25_08090 [Comamonadaceae bacterium]|nr:MAG: hypothetical protein EOO25_08090 [Comamonadaceae bacterium]
MIAVVVLLASLVLGSLASPADVVDWTAEEGFIERSTLMLYFLAALAVAGDRERLHAPVWIALAALLAAAAGRELDWHKTFTGTSMLKLSYYLGEAPLRHKLAALAILACLVAAAAYLALRFARSTWRGLRARDAAAVTAATFLACMVISKLVDRSLTVLAQDWHLSISAQARSLQLAVEELMELELPALVLLGLVQLRLAARQVDPVTMQAAASHPTTPPRAATAMHQEEAPPAPEGLPRG